MSGDNDDSEKKQQVKKPGIVDHQYLEKEYKQYIKKLDSSLLPFLDEKFLPPGQSPEDYQDTMQKLGQFIPAGSALPGKELLAPADIIYLEINLEESFTTKSVEPFTWLTINHSDKHHLVIAWVRVNNLKSLAEQDAVRFIRPVIPPIVR